MKMAPAIGMMLASLLIAQVSGAPAVLNFYQTYPTRNENNEVVYEYRYSVDSAQSGVVTDRWEQRVGQFVKGSYSLLEPSGKVRTVSYEVDGARGFIAVVKTTFPAAVLQSTQQLYRSDRLHPQPSTNLRRAVPPPTSGSDPPRNYHALEAQTFTPAVSDVTRFQPSQQGFQSGFQGGGFSSRLHSTSRTPLAIV